MKRLLIICFSLLALSNLFCQKIRILTNHLGYNPIGSKCAIVQAFSGDEINNCFIKYFNDDKLVAAVKPIYIGKIDEWKNWYFWTIDFSSVQLEGDYYIECETNKGIIHSFPFKIQKDILERHTISDVIFYFRGQRAVGQFEKADRNIRFKESNKEAIDAHGGWQDASGDYGKHLSHLSFSTYFNPQQISITSYSLHKSLELLTKRNNENFNQFRRRLVDEALYGADYLVRIKNPVGSFYLSVSAPGPKKAPEDRIIPNERTGFTVTQYKDERKDTLNSTAKPVNKTYEASYRAGAGLAIASLAMASQLNVSENFSSKVYLKSAEDAFNYLELNNTLLTNDGKENIVDDYCALTAATELFKATNNNVYKTAANKRANNLVERLSTWNKYSNYLRADDYDRPFFHAADAGLPLVALIYYMDICSNEFKNQVLSTIKKSLEFELAITSEVPNAFGYARQLVQHKDGKRNSAFFFPHDTETEPWWQGENARLSSLATAARLAMPLFSNDLEFYKKLEAYSINQLNWILGLNPYDSSMLYGKGRNNIEYMFFGTYQYTNAPGGICNGITSGLNNEHDIDYNLLYSETGKDYDWRWGEQWLPHAAWYLLAVSAGK